MANVKISDLSALSGEVLAATLFEAEAAGVSVKVTGAQFQELIRDTVAALLIAGSNVTITPNDASDTITIAAAGGGGGGNTYGERHIGLVSGRAYASYGQNPSGNASPPADLLLAIPLCVPLDTTLAGIMLRVSTASAGGLCKVARYTDVGGVPGALIAEASAPLDLSVANKALTATFGGGNFAMSAATPQFVVLLFNPSATSAALVAQAPADPKGKFMLGSEASDYGIAGAYQIITGVGTYAGGFPSTFGTPTYAIAQPPMVWMKIA